MTDTPSAILLLRLQSTGSNTNLWGGYLNTIFQTLERGQRGYQAYTVTGDATISWSNYSASNDFAVAFAKLAGSPTAAFTLTLPGYQNYFGVNNPLSYAGTFKVSGGTGIAVPASRNALLYGDGTDIYEASPNWLSAPVSTLSNAGDIVVKTTLESAIANASGLTAPFILVDASDTTAGYLSAKVLVTGDASAAVTTPGGDEALTITADARPTGLAMALAMSADP
jgi:hypothetical protein